MAATEGFDDPLTGDLAAADLMSWLTSGSMRFATAQMHCMSCPRGACVACNGLWMALENERIAREDGHKESQRSVGESA